MKGWDGHVYRTDGEERVYVGFFFDDTQAQAWVDAQTEGTYEVSTEGPERPEL